MTRLIWERFHSLPIIDMTVGESYARVPDLQYSHLDWSLEVLNEIVEMHVEETATMGRLDMKSDEGSRFHRREFVRIGAFVCLATSIEGIFEAHYRKMSRDVARWVNTEVANPELVVRDMRQRFARVRRMRNKVHAHTAYEKPQGDSESMQLYSVMLLSGAIMKRTDDNVVIVGGDNEMLRYPGDNVAMPEWSVPTLVDFYASQILLWRRHFSALAQPLEKLTLADVLGVEPHAVNVLVCGRPAR